MIYGGTYTQQAARKQAERQSDTFWRLVFVWRPVRLDDGRKAWLETVWTRRHPYCGRQYRPALETPGGDDD